MTRDIPAPSGYWAKQKNQRGRPKVLYRKKRANQLSLKPSTHIDIEHILNSKNSKKPNLPSTVAVEVEFQKLKIACRYGKGGNCKQKIKKGILEKCTLSKCPLVLNVRLAK